MRHVEGEGCKSRSPWRPVPAALAPLVAALAVTSTRRSPKLLQVPTAAKAGVQNYESTLAYGVMAPRGTLEPVLRTLGAALARAVESPQLRDALLAEGAEPLAGSAADFAELMRAESEKWARVIQAAGVKAD